jgi:clan AA aspartic protease (TIGR02281 family)
MKAALLAACAAIAALTAPAHGYSFPTPQELCREGDTQFCFAQEPTTRSGIPAKTPAPRPSPRPPSQTDDGTVPIYLNDGGRSVWVDVQLGSLTQRMLIDTGATSISVPNSVANELLRHGEATLDDPGQVTIANGSTYAVSLIRIDTVRVGNRVLHDVIAGVSPEQASPLLGFPVLNQAGRFTIDTKSRQLIFD